MTDFVNNLDHINALAEKSEGFVWRLKDENDNATAIKVFEDDYLLINMSVWKDVDTLYDYVYHSLHVEIFKRRKEWFHNMSEMHMAFWYIENGVYPKGKDGKDRLEHIQLNGETPYAFSFKNRFSETDLIILKT